jgi:hypothetical protein
MVFATRSVEEFQQSETGEPFPTVKLPKLGHQRSLQSLIGEELSSQCHGSLEMAALLMRRDENADSDGATIGAPASETPDERHETPAASTRGHKSIQDQETAYLHRDTGFPHASLWRRLFGRYDSKYDRARSKFETDIQWRRQAVHEQPKTVYSHKRRQILREVIMVHFMPVAINFTLLGMYLRRVSWTPPWPTTNVLNALQFAAKMHETLMITSLVTVLLHHIRYRLLSLGQRGLPLGLITSPFRLLDITYLWSREFLATVASLGSHHNRHPCVPIHPRSGPGSRLRHQHATQTRGVGSRKNDYGCPFLQNT